MSRKEIAEKLYTAATYYFTKKTYSVHREFGIEKWGRRRLDLLCFNFMAEFIGVEIKSCLADYRTDTKWRMYLPYVNKLYFCVPPEMTRSKVWPQIVEEVKAEGVGIMTIKDGRVTVIVNAKKRHLDPAIKNKFLLKMAWRGGRNRANTKRTYKVDLE